MNSRNAKVALAVALVLVLIGGVVAMVRAASGAGQTNIVAYFENSNGIYEGDNVVILGVQVGKIHRIEPQPERVKISFWVDDKYKVPVEAKAVILSPSLVTVRAIQLTPAYTSGPVMQDDTVIPRERTAVPVEYDDLRQQLERLAETLQPTQPGEASTLGAFVNTAADNLRGQGADIRETVIKLSQAINAIGDHSDDLFGTFQNLAALVSALQDSTGLLGDLNQNLAAVTGLLANDRDEVESAVRLLNEVADDVRSFVADNRETLGTTSDKLASVSTAVVEVREDLKQTLHIAPPLLQNFENLYEPAHSSLTGSLAFTNFANPIQFICGAVQAASRLGMEQAAKMCVQYLAPIVKNRQLNFLPFGLNPFVNAQARPNEVTYAEDWLRPDYIPPPAPTGGAPTEEPGTVAPPPNGPLPPPNQIYNRFGEPADPRHGDPPFVPAKPPNPIPTNPAVGLPGMMVPPGGGQ